MVAFLLYIISYLLFKIASAQPGNILGTITCGQEVGDIFLNAGNWRAWDFTITTSPTRTVTFRTCNSAPNVEARLRYWYNDGSWKSHVCWYGSTDGSGTCNFCNGDENMIWEQDISPGSYYIEVAPWSGTSGIVKVKMECNVIPTTQPTLMPVTAAPITNAPTTSIPTTDMPSNAPTTDTPTTDMPTNMPVTKQPTTTMPTTDIPTNIPTTSAPITKNPTSDMPTTDMSTTSAPVTNEPTSGMPTTDIPTGIPSSIPVTSVPSDIPSTSNPTVLESTMIQTTYNSESVTGLTTIVTGGEAEQTETSAFITTDRGSDGLANEDVISETVIIVIVIGVLSVVILFVMIIYCCYKKRKNMDKNNDKDKLQNEIELNGVTNAKYVRTNDASPAISAISTNTPNDMDDGDLFGDDGEEDEEGIETLWDINTNNNMVTPNGNGQTAGNITDMGHDDDDSMDDGEDNSLYEKGNVLTPKQEYSNDDVLYGNANKKTMGNTQL